jgi:hypothetical protein
VGRSKVIGLPLWEAFADFEGQQAFELYEQVYSTGEPLTLRGYRVQMELGAATIGLKCSSISWCCPCEPTMAPSPG